MLIVGLLPQSLPVLALAGLLLGFSVFAAVHHAELLALKMGEPFGSILLAIAVTVMEVGLIVSIMASDTAGSDTIARDTVFSAVMIVLNGVIGLCLVAGAHRHFEQVFRADGVTASMAVLGTLAAFALVVPNYTLQVPGPYYSPGQLIFVGIISLVLYVLFIFVQTSRHRDYFVSPATAAATDPEIVVHEAPSPLTTAICALLLCIALVAVIVIAKVLSYPLKHMLADAGLAPGFLGVLVAMVVLLPESVAALRAAMANQLQNALNLALGSALASVAITIPAVAAVSILLDRKLQLGLPAQDMAMLIITYLISTLTLATGRTTVLHGAVQLVIFAAFVFLAAFP